MIGNYIMLIALFSAHFAAVTTPSYSLLDM
jgi:hypothetical protein